MPRSAVYSPTDALVLRAGWSQAFRFPNFSDVSADVELDGFQVLVGNEKDQPLRPVTLREYLGTSAAPPLDERTVRKVLQEELRATS